MVFFFSVVWCVLMWGWGEERRGRGTRIEVVGVGESGRRREMVGEEKVTQREAKGRGEISDTLLRWGREGMNAYDWIFTFSV